MLGFASLSSVPLSSLPSAGHAAAGFVSGSFGTPIAAYARTQGATGAAPSTTFGTAKFGTTVAATGIAPNTKYGAPPYFGPNILQILGNGADGEATFTDGSPYYATLTRNGSIAKSTAQSRFGSGSIALTGSSTANNVSTPYDKRFNLVGDQFTIEAEVYLNAYNASGGRLLSSGAGANGWNVTNGFQWLLQTNGAGIQFGWLWYGLSGGFWGWYQQSLSVALSLSTWAQVKVTFDGATVRLFLDGALAGSSAKPPIIYGGSTTAPAAVAVGALVGEPTGATYAANAYIQHIRVRTDCTDVAAFSAPTAGLQSWIGELAGIAPTVQVPAPRSGFALPATGFTPILFGTGFGQNLQRPTGFQVGVVGDPRIFPYSPPPVASTQFGSARLFPFHVAPGVRAVVSSAVLGWQYWRVPQALPFGSIGTPTTPTNRAGGATGFAPARFGRPLATRRMPGGVGVICTPSGFAATGLGSPSARWTQYGAAQPIAPVVHAGTPAGSTVHHAADIAPVQTGVPAVRLVQRAAAVNLTTTGAIRAILTQRASGASPKVRFGAHKTIRPNWYEVRGFCPFRAGNPRGYQRNNYATSGFAAAQFGLAGAHEVHRVSPLPPTARPGAPLLKRNTQC